MSADLKVPEGWTWKRREAWRFLWVARWPGKGAVSIDFDRRCFAVGDCVPHTSPGAYSGRGWKQKLVDDAVAELQKIYKDEK